MEDYLDRNIRSAELSTLLNRHGSEPRSNRNENMRVTDLPLDRSNSDALLLSLFIESQVGQQPNIDAKIPLSYNSVDGYIQLSGLKCLKMAFSDMVKSVGWDFCHPPCDNNDVCAAAFVRKMNTRFCDCMLTKRSGASLVFGGDRDGLSGEHVSGVYSYELTVQSCVHFFLGWRVSLQNTTFDRLKRDIGVYYVYEKNLRAGRFCDEGYALCWIKPDGRPCLNSFRNMYKYGYLVTVFRNHPMPVQASLSRQCRSPQPPVCDSNFWSVLLQPMRNKETDVFASSTLGNHSLITFVADFVLSNTFRLFQKTARYALAAVWSGADPSAGMGLCMARGSGLFATAQAYLGPCCDDRGSLAPFLYNGAPPAYVKFLWGARNPDSHASSMYEKIDHIGSRRAHLEKLLSGADEDVLSIAKSYASFEILTLFSRDLKSFIESGGHSCTFPDDITGVVPHILGRRCKKICKMLTSTQRMNQNEDTLRNLYRYTKKQIRHLKSRVTTQGTDEERRYRPLCIVWIYSEAEHDAMKESLTGLGKDMDVILEYQESLYDEYTSPKIQCLNSQLDSRILYRHHARLRDDLQAAEKKAEKRPYDAIDKVDEILNRARTKCNGDEELIGSLKKLRKCVAESLFGNATINSVA